METTLGALQHSPELVSGKQMLLAVCPVENQMPSWILYWAVQMKGWPILLQNPIEANDKLLAWATPNLTQTEASGSPSPPPQKKRLWFFCVCRQTRASLMATFFGSLTFIAHVHPLQERERVLPLAGLFTGRDRAAEADGIRPYLGGPMEDMCLFLRGPFLASLVVSKGNQ